MNLRPLYALALFCALAELGGCKSLLKKKDPDPAPPAAPVVVAPPAVVAPVPGVVSAAPVAAAPVIAPPVLDENAVPTPQDFEDEAAQKVTTANFKAQFATLKTAISK